MKNAFDVNRHGHSPSKVLEHCMEFVSSEPTRNYTAVYLGSSDGRKLIVHGF
jgi:hypothetical protein